MRVFQRISHCIFLMTLSLGLEGAWTKNKFFFFSGSFWGNVHIPQYASPGVSQNTKFSLLFHFINYHNYHSVVLVVADILYLGITLLCWHREVPAVGDNLGDATISAQIHCRNAPY